VNSVAIINTGGANITSLRYAFERLGTKVTLTADPAVIRRASHVVLPGVGAAQNAMERLRAAGLVDVVRDLTQPVLGICLGMQLLCDGSEEENVECLGILPGVARLLPASPDCTVPNMGWCETKWVSEHALLQRITNQSYFYYLHSYALPVSEFTIARANHAEPFSAVVRIRNFFATQFHPERSSSTGATLLGNFLGIRA